MCGYTLTSAVKAGQDLWSVGSRYETGGGYQAEKGHVQRPCGQERFMLYGYWQQEGQDSMTESQLAFLPLPDTVLLARPSAAQGAASMVTPHKLAPRWDGTCLASLSSTGPSIHSCSISKAPHLHTPILSGSTAHTERCP